MAHHGWITVLDPATLPPSGLKSPFGRLFESSDISYDSLGIALMAGANGPMMQTIAQEKAAEAAPHKPPNPAGFTFLGQFIDHDLTEFRVLSQDDKVIPSNPTIGQRQRVLEDGAPSTTNGRTGTLDLDSVYGLLGIGQPDLYDQNGKFRLNATGDDLLRQPTFRNGRLIADPRNDENKIVVQIHMLFEHLHNKLHPGGLPGSASFLETSRRVRNVYRRIVVNDYLPRIVQQKHIDMVAAALAKGTSFYQAMNLRAANAYSRHLGERSLDNTPASEKGGAVPGRDQAVGNTLVSMPVEFSHAVFRLGHSQLRGTYPIRKSLDGGGVPLFGGPFDLRGNSPLVVERLNADGTKDAIDFHIDLRLFFEETTGPDGTSHPRLPGRPIDPKLPEAVFRLPPPAIGEPPVSLAERNIRRGVDFGLPSGQEAASYLTKVYGGIEGLFAEALFPDAEFADTYREVLATAPNMAWATPLWYYMLCEAGRNTTGPQLGDVGGLIVAETILGALSTIDPADGFDPAPKGKDDESISSIVELLDFLNI